MEKLVHKRFMLPQMKLPDWNIIVCNKIAGNFCSDFPGNALVRSGLDLEEPDWALKFTQPLPASDNGQFGEELFFFMII